MDNLPVSAQGRVRPIFASEIPAFFWLGKEDSLPGIRPVETCFETWEEQHWHKAQPFLSLKPWHDIKSYCEDEIGQIVRGEHIFCQVYPTPAQAIKSLTDLLERRVYTLRTPPRMMQLPQHTYESMLEICEKEPTAFRYICDSVVGEFLGNSYSMDFRDMVGVGERISPQRLKELLPNGYAAILGSVDSSNVEKIVVRTGDRKGIEREFYRSLFIEDLPALLSLFDRHQGTDASAARVIRAEWPRFADRFDGLSFTDLVTTGFDSSVKEKWREHNVHRQWAADNAICLGTIADLVRDEVIKWPAAPRDSMKDKLTQLTNYFRSNAKPDRKTAYDSAVAELKDRLVTGTKTFPPEQKDQRALQL